MQKLRIFSVLKETNKPCNPENICPRRASQTSLLETLEIKKIICAIWLLILQHLHVFIFHFLGGSMYKIIIKNRRAAEPRCFSSSVSASLSASLWKTTFW